MSTKKKSISKKHRSGFVSVLGPPNAGKSTLVNALVGSKVAIVSEKPQTTRGSIQAVLNVPGAQVVFVDTPGVHEAGKLIHKRMMESVKQALNDRDLLLWVVDATQPAGAAGLEALQLLEGNTAPRFLLLNKVDAVRNKSSLLPLIEAYQQKTGFAEVLPISAKTGAGLDGLKAAILKVLPEGPQYFPPDFITDQPERHMAAELIREHVLHQTHQEVPHAVAVTVEQWADTRRLLRIAATVYVERDGQKRILVGTGGAQLKSIGTAARQDIEKLTGRKVFLELFVKVRPKWRDSPGFLDELDWRYTAGKEQ